MAPVLMVTVPALQTDIAMTDGQVVEIARAGDRWRMRTVMMITGTATADHHGVRIEGIGIGTMIIVDSRARPKRQLRRTRSGPIEIGTMVRVRVQPLEDAHRNDHSSNSSRESAHSSSGMWITIMIARMPSLACKCVGGNGLLIPAVAAATWCGGIPVALSIVTTDRQ